MGKEFVKSVLLLALLLLVVGLILQLHRVCPLYERALDCSCDSLAKAHQFSPSSPSKFLSYQPPGNGWNNQRIALENAFVLAKLLNRTLLVQPLAPHKLGSQLKIGHLHGYLAYNMINTSDLLPPSDFLDLELMSQVVPVLEVRVSHPEFVTHYHHLTWKNICHTPGYGFWMDQLPKTAAEVDMLTRQQFSSLGKVWKEKCTEEKLRVEQHSESMPLIRYITDLQGDPSEMLYFERGTLFGIQIRFTTAEKALQAQKWVMDHVHYSPSIWRKVREVEQTIGPHFNAIQVRRKNHMDSRLPPSYWLERMAAKNYSKIIPVYVATNDDNEEWFQPFLAEGYRLYFYKDIAQHLSLSAVKESLRMDLLGIHEQCLCINAGLFVGSPASTFNALILRHRGEVEKKGQYILDTLHTYWIGHQVH